GKGEPTHETMLKQKSADLPVEFLGFVQPTEFFEKIDILIVPSWEEPFGIVLLEAMASGVPVIATDCGGPKEILPATLVPPDDPTALANAIRSVKSSEGIREARDHVEKNFDMCAVVPKIESFYRNLLSVSI